AGPRGDAVVDRHRVDVCVVTIQEKERRRQLRKQLPKELAHGTKVETWAETKGVAKRTAYRWAADPEIKAKAQAIRLRDFDRVVGKMTSRLEWASDQVFELGNKASSESVRLAAARSLFKDVISVSKFSVLDHRMTKIEERIRAHGGKPARP